MAANNFNIGYFGPNLSDNSLSYDSSMGLSMDANTALASELPPLTEEDLDYFLAQSDLTQFNNHLSAIPNPTMQQVAPKPLLTPSPAVQQFDNGMIMFNGRLFQPVPAVQQIPVTPQQQYPDPSRMYGTVAPHPYYSLYGTPSMYGMPQEVMPAPVAQMATPESSDGTEITGNKITLRNKRKQISNDEDSKESLTIDTSLSRPTKAIRRVDTRPQSKESVDILSEATIIKVCVCDPNVKVKRPKNPFMIYRTMMCKSEDFAPYRKNNAAMSVKLGESWRALPANKKNWFVQAAAKEAEQHAAENPGYKYKPGMKKRSQFGAPDCKCGAYQMNMAAIHSADDTGRFRRASNHDEDSDGEYDARKPSRGIKRQPKPSNTVNLHQVQTVRSAINSNHARPTSAGQRSVSFHEPQPARRSSRNSGKTTNYNEDVLAGTDLASTEATTTIATTRSGQVAAAKSPSIISGISPKTTLTPRRSTSARRESSIAGKLPTPTFESLLGEDANFDYLMNFTFEGLDDIGGEDIGENIVVATPVSAKQQQQQQQRKRSMSLRSHSSRSEPSPTSPGETPRRSSRLSPKV